jgi:hypothetical protein
MCISYSVSICVKMVVSVSLPLLCGELEKKDPGARVLVSFLLLDKLAALLRPAGPP